MRLPEEYRHYIRGTAYRPWLRRRPRRKWFGPFFMTIMFHGDTLGVIPPVVWLTYKETR